MKGIMFTENLFRNIDLQDLDGEIWVPVKFFERKLHVSNYGRVKSPARFVNNRHAKWLKESKILCQSFTGPGRDYLKISIRMNGKSKNLSVHRLVAKAFIPNPLEKPCVNHLNGNKSDNRVENLEWCTYSENHIHAYKLRLRSPKNQRGSNNGNVKLTEMQVLEVRSLRGIVTQKKLAAKFNVDQTTISDIQLRKRWNHI